MNNKQQNGIENQQIDITKDYIPCYTDKSDSTCALLELFCYFFPLIGCLICFFWHDKNQQYFNASLKASLLGFCLYAIVILNFIFVINLGLWIATLL